MKRDFELIRLILLKAEEESVQGQAYHPVIDGYDKQTISEHINLMGEKEYLIVIPIKNKEGRMFYVEEIRMAGYDYLDAVRNNAVWDRIKLVLGRKSIPFSFEMIKAASSTILTQMLTSL
jgi:hypothetical protein